MLTIAYTTSRKEPKIEWFFAALQRETNGNFSDIKVIVIDFYCGQRALPESPFPYCHVPPKPCVWQGPHRITSKDYFAASSARNTAICLAPDGWIAFVDDLSFFMPGWLNHVRDGISKNRVTLGSYMKVKNLQVLGNGEVSYDLFPPGIDSRLSHLKHGPKRGPVATTGSWFFGCSAVAPVEAMLKINGFDEDCCSLGGEDYIAGLMLEKAGCQLWYYPDMMTLESEEGHHNRSGFERFDKGKSPNDKSHAMLHKVLNGRRIAPNVHFGPGGLRGLREIALSGKPFPIPTGPTHDWYDNQPLSEL